MSRACAGGSGFLGNRSTSGNGGTASIGDSDSPGLLRSGIAAVERMSDGSRRDSALAAQAQPSQVNHDKKSTILVIAAVAVVAIIWLKTDDRFGRGLIRLR